VPTTLSVAHLRLVPYVAVDEHLDDLDDGARLALEVAMGAAAALGDHQCGTEYLLYGLFATARGELNEIADLFALGALRMERAVQKLREPYTCDGSAYDGDPVFSTRAMTAMHTLRHDGTGPTGVFELLFGILQDSRSGACAVLRELGVRPEEVHRLAAYGRRHLTRDEAQALLEALDRRDRRRAQPWWGPLSESLSAPDRSALVPLTFGGERSIQVANSQSTVATVTDLAAGHDGFSITLVVESLQPWVLNPVIDRALLEQGIDAIVESGGFLDGGQPACETMRAFADDMHLDLSFHQSRPVDEWAAKQASLILTMQRNHARDLIVEFGVDARRVFTLGGFLRLANACPPMGEPFADWLAALSDHRSPSDLLSKSGPDEISDPHGGSKRAHRRTFEQLQRNAALVADVLAKVQL